MISYQQAYKKVLEHSRDYGNESVALSQAAGRVLAEDIIADRDFPPFDRSTKDGISLAYEAVEKGIVQFKVEGILPAGTPKGVLSHKNNCQEIMTGAVIPNGADTVVMYEDITIEDGWATLNKKPVKGQNIHQKGSDEKEGAIVIKKNTKISAAEIGILAAVGKTKVLVKKLPNITLISTGNELVEVSETPLPHQIRKSNMHSLFAALSLEGIIPKEIHLKDEKESIRQGLEWALRENDVLLLSGGVSKGKYDFIPAVMEELGVEKIFHRVMQRPGKPFWFGHQKETKTIIFSFPGNPVSTFANYHVYFKDWLKKTLQLPIPKIEVVLTEEISAKGTLTLFLRVKISLEEGNLMASLVNENGSGDLTSLARSDGFIRLSPRESLYLIGENVPFVPTRSLM